MKYDDNSAAIIIENEHRQRNFSCVEKAETFVAEHNMRRIKVKAKRIVPISRSYECSKQRLDRVNRKNCSIFLKCVEKELQSDRKLGWLRLLISLNTGYLARLMVSLGLEKYPQSRKRAPVYWIKTGTDSQLRDELEIFSHLLPENSIDVSHAVQRTPVLFPRDYAHEKVTDCAYLRIKKNKHIKLFPQYRDCGVIIDSRMLKKNELNHFIHQNPWSSIVIIGQRNPKVKQDGILSLDITDLDWHFSSKKAKAIREVMTQFHWWLYETFPKRNKLKKYWTPLNSYVSEITRGDQFWYQLQLLAAELFAEYVQDALGKKKHKYRHRDYSARWKNLILPCCTVDEEDIPLQEQSIIAEENYPKIFCETMKVMFQDLTRFLYVPRSQDHIELCPKEDDKGNPYYGYHRWKMDGRKYDVPVIYFRRKDFLKHFAICAPFKCDSKAILEYCEDHDPSEYFVKRKKGSRKDRIPENLEDTNPVPSVALLLNKLDFLDETIKQQLLTPLLKERENAVSTGASRTDKDS